MKRVPLVLIVAAVIGGVIFAIERSVRPPATLDDLLSHVPENAALVVAFPDLAHLDGGTLALGAACQADFGPGFSRNLLGLLPVSDETLARAVADRAALVVALRPECRAPLVLVGVHGRHNLHGPDRETVRIDGNVLMASRDPAWFEGSHAAGKPGPARWPAAFAADSRTNHLLVHIDVPRWKDAIERKLFLFGSMATMATAAQGEGSVDLIHAMTDAVRSLIGQLDSITVAGYIGGAGIRVHCAIHPRTGGPIADYLASASRIEPPWPQIAGADSGRLLGFLGGAWRLEQGQVSLMEVTSRLLCDATKDSADVETAEMEKAVEVCRRIDGQFVTVLLDEKNHAQAITFVSAREPELALDGMARLTHITQTATGRAMIENTRTTHETIAGRKATVACITMAMPDPIQQQMVKSMYGGVELCTVYLPAPGGFWTCVSTPAASRALAEQLATGALPPLRDDPRVREALASITPNPDGLGLMDVSQVVRFGLRLAAALNLPDVQLPPDAGDGATPPPFVVGGLYLRPAACEFEVRVPAAAIGDLLRIGRVAGQPQ